MRALLSLLVIASCSAPQPSGDGSIAGTWTGTVTQQGDTYGLVFSISDVAPGEEAGKAAYDGSDFECVGTLTFVGEQDGLWTYSEQVDDQEACVDGTITASLLADGTLQWRWYENRAGSPDATATLDRR
ncbi:MAG: hypothetical protein AAGK21_12115 [Bacteroidota bacterium]